MWFPVCQERIENMEMKIQHSLALYNAQRHTFIYSLQSCKQSEIMFVVWCSGRSAHSFPQSSPNWSEIRRTWERILGKEAWIKLTWLWLNLAQTEAAYTWVPLFIWFHILNIKHQKLVELCAVPLRWGGFRCSSDLFLSFLFFCCLFMNASDLASARREKSVTRNVCRVTQEGTTAASNVLLQSCTITHKLFPSGKLTDLKWRYKNCFDIFLRQFKRPMSCFVCIAILLKCLGKMLLADIDYSFEHLKEDLCMVHGTMANPLRYSNPYKLKGQKEDH